MSNNNKLTELRYKGDYGFSLHSVHADYEAAMAAKREAVRTAQAAGNQQLANSFAIV